MAKQGMKRPELSGKKNSVPPVPEISGKAKHGHEKARPMIAEDPSKVWHGAPHGDKSLEMENLLNDFDMTAADIQDFWRKW